MLFWIVTVLIAQCSAQLPIGTTEVNDAEHIALVNTAPKRTWTAAYQKLFDGLTFEDAKGFLGASLSNISKHLSETRDNSVYAAIPDESLPNAFDAREAWPGLTQPIRSRRGCGSCWALSASDVLADRTSISQRSLVPALSSEDMVRCSGLVHDCQHREVSSAWGHLSSSGVATDSCVPSSVHRIRATQCAAKCKKGSSERLQRFRAASAYAIAGATNMHKEILSYGPIQAAFAVYKSFFVYRSGVYQKHWWESIPEGGHAVRILGWGTQARTPFWLAANSWGTTWGEKGFFKIFRGEQSCGIEELGPPYAGLPAARQADFIV